MKVNENDLREIIRLALFNVTDERNKKATDKFKELMFNMYGYTGGEAIDILNGKLPVELMQKDLMFRVTKVLYELNKHIDGTFDIEKLDVNNYFTEREIEDYNKKIEKNTKDDDVVITQWLRVADDQYIIVLSLDEISDLVNRNKLRYNPETQRDLTIKETKNGKVKVITWFPDSFNNICEAMKNDLYISDTLSLNVNPDYYAPPKIIKGNLVIPKESVIDCIDGFHRFKAAITTKMGRASWNQLFIFNLMVFDKDKAVRFILQQDKKNHLSDAQTTRTDTTDPVNFIIDKLNDSTKFILRGKIIDEISYTFNKVVNKLFEPKKLYTTEDRKEAVNLYNLIEKNFNELIEQNSLYSKELSKEEWFIYLYILKYATDNQLEFIELVNKLSISSIIDEVKFVNQPSSKHYKYMSEVINNAR